MPCRCSLAPSTEPVAARLAVQLLQALAYLHDRGVRRLTLPLSAFKPHDLTGLTPLIKKAYGPHSLCSLPSGMP